jgi:two-component system sensor histidine kinase HydH
LARGKPAQLHASDPGTQVDRELFERLGTDTVAVVPLFVRGELAGVIIADNLITRKAINEADLNVLKTFAGYAGLALERSHLYDELRQSVAKLQAANETLKTSQQRLLQAEKLSAIGELAAYVSHEIRNPLVAIGGLARSLIKDQVDDPDTAETLQIIATQVNRLEKFLRETLDFVKPRVAGVVPADVLQIVRESLATFKNELSENAIEVELETSEDAVICQIDPDLLRHALSNLIKNAIEAMKGGGRLLVGVVKNGVSGTIRIGDTGPGIPAEARPRIFDPFFTTKPEGTGLGLSIASQNIRGLGGQLELEPGDEYRTVFRLTLPLQLRQELVTARS